MKCARLFGILLVSAALLWGCGADRGPTGPDPAGYAGGGPSWLPPGARLDSAHLLLHVRHASGDKVIIHPLVGGWDEMSVTWNSLGPGLSPFVITSFRANDSGWITLNVSGLVAAWLDSIWDNRGLVLDQNPPEFARTAFDSRESPGLGPKLKIFCSDPACPEHLFAAAADAYIQQQLPDANAGRDSVLYSGALSATGAEDRAVIRFDLAAQDSFLTLGDRVWTDLDADGVQDAEEPGQSGVVVNAYDCAGNPVASTVTDAGGTYLFESLPFGNYVLEFEAPAGYVFSPPHRGAGPGADSDADPVTGCTACIEPVAAGSDLSWDAGLYVPRPVDPGCTHGKGWWKHQAGLGVESDEVIPYLPIYLGVPGGAKTLAVEDAAQAYAVLQQHTYGQPANGITKLYAQLLTAKLNVAAGAAPEAIEEKIDEADALLATNNFQDWEAMGKPVRQMVYDWHYWLERYNEGDIGPGSCGEDDGPEIMYEGTDRDLADKLK